MKCFLLIVVMVVCVMIVGIVSFNVYVNEEYKLGLVIFLFGVVFGFFGILVKNVVDLVIDVINDGILFVLIKGKGIDGWMIILVYVDEVGGVIK